MVNECNIDMRSLLQQQLYMTLEQYEVKSKLGNGKYAAVYRVHNLISDQEYALKRVPLDQMNLRLRTKSLNQAKLLQSLKHPNIVTLQEVQYDTSNGHLCMILELAQKDLNTVIYEHDQPLKESFIWMVLSQISAGLLYLHSHSILHRDIKTTNILMFEGDIAKISDLNVSTTLQQLNYTRTGTLTYASPQIWKGETYDTKADIWSLGCLVYEMLTKRRPFDGEDMEQLSKQITKCQYQKIQENYSKELKDLIYFMIQINPRLRPSAKTINTMCKNKCKNYQQHRKSKNIRSLTPFLQNENSQTSLLDSHLSCNDYGTKTVIKRQGRHPIDRIMRKSIEPSRTEMKRNNTPHMSMFKASTHYYRRVTTQNSEKEGVSHKLEEAIDEYVEPTKTIKFLPKRLNKLTSIKLNRRHTEL